MATPNINCPDCGSRMEEGYVYDRGHYDAGHVETWVEGEPERSFWAGLKTSDRAQFSVRTFRCSNCGLLKSYADRDAKKKRA